MKVYLTGIMIFVLLSCGSSSGSTGSSVNPHAKAHQEMHEEFYREVASEERSRVIEELAGTFKGKIPCADCEGIEFELVLNDDMTYSSSKRHIGKSDQPIQNQGSYSLSDSWLITLIDETGSVSYFQKEGDGLRVLDRNGKRIEGDLEDLYLLYPWEM
jgi:uncharacterized lipoprotein NlpE involved in copper resistance